jgi:hypothetical protein
VTAANGAHTLHLCKAKRLLRTQNMPNDQEPQGADQKSENLLVSTARVIGRVAGTVASTVVHPASAPVTPETRRIEVKRGKFPKSTKSRLPRRQKKAIAKTQAAAALQ